jgi:hypothetical protein
VPLQKPLFQIGDQVTWRSQAGGSSTEKTGKIMAIVPSGTDVWSAVDVMDDPFSFAWRIDRQSRIARRHESYLVSVTRDSGKPLLYWPRINTLRCYQDRSDVRTQEEIT